MSIRLADLLGPREVALSYGVKVTLSPIGFADLKAAEASAYREARDRLRADAEQASLSETAVDAVDQLSAAVEEVILDRLVIRHVQGWSGVVEEDGVTPAPFTAENWRKFRDGVPILADQLRAAIRMPVEMIAAEGNDSAP